MDSLAVGKSEFPSRHGNPVSTTCNEIIYC